MMKHSAGLFEYVLVVIMLVIGAYSLFTLVVQPTTNLMNADAEMVISKCGAN